MSGTTTSTDYSSLLANVDTSSLQTEIMSAGGILLGVSLVYFGVRRVLSMFGGR